MSPIPAGYSGTPLAKKLGIREGHRVATLGAPDGFPELLAPLPPGVEVRADPRARRLFDVVVAFVVSPRELERRFARGDAILDTNGGLWIAWPKRTSALATDLKESHVREHGLGQGLVDNKICAVDHDWSGVRFVVRTSERATRAAERASPASGRPPSPSAKPRSDGRSRRP